MARSRVRIGPACRVCGCTEDHACDGGCWWVRVEARSSPLCSACAGTAGDMAEVLKRIKLVKPGDAPLDIAPVINAALRRRRERARLEEQA